MSAIRQTGLQVGNLHHLVRLGQDGGAFRHEVYPAKHDVARRLTSRRLLGKVEGIAPVVSHANDFPALVMMRQDQEVMPQGRLAGQYRLHQLFIFPGIRPNFTKRPCLKTLVRPHIDAKPFKNSVILNIVYLSIYF
jgi:hypothetical protein